MKMLQFHIVCSKQTNLDFSRVEIAAAARRDGGSCGSSPLESITTKQTSSETGSPQGVNLALCFSGAFKEIGKK
jgi:hypothetical protein